MKVAIVGSSGYIAGYLLNNFEQDGRIEKVLKIDQTDNADKFLDLLRPQEFDYSVLDGIDVIVFTAAISGPDKCSIDYDLCYNINVKGTSYFIKRVIEKNCKVLFFSSDAVFGCDKGSFNEFSETHANTPYGKMKKAVEDEFKTCDKFKAIRLSYVVSAKDRFVSYCLNCIKQNETAEIFHPFYRNCITVGDVVNVVSWLINNWDNYECSFLNVAGKELVSRVRIADEINRIVKGKLSYTIKTPPKEFFNNRPEVTQMESLFLFDKNIIKCESFSDKIKYQLKELGL